MYVDEFGLTLGAPLATIVLEITDQFLALSVDRDDRLSSAEEVDRLRVDVTKLCVAIDVVAAFPCLAVCLQAVVHPAQQIANNRRANLVPLRPQLFGEIGSGRSTTALAWGRRASSAQPEPSGRATALDPQRLSFCVRHQAYGYVRPPPPHHRECRKGRDKW